MKYFRHLPFLFASILLFPACRQDIKVQDDEIYSRHLQRHVPLTVITTPMPDNKADMNLLLMNSQELLENVQAKRIIDSLYAKKLIRPLTLVAFDGKKENYGINMSDNDQENLKAYRKFSDFITGELYPFIKKKVVIQKFRSVAICGVGLSANNAFHIALHNSDKVQMAGLFYPTFYKGQLESLAYMRSRATVEIFLTTAKRDSIADRFADIRSYKPGIATTAVYAAEGANGMPAPATFAKFVVWAFPK